MASRLNMFVQASTKSAFVPAAPSISQMTTLPGISALPMQFAPFWPPIFIPILPANANGKHSKSAQDEEKRKAARPPSEERKTELKDAISKYHESLEEWLDSLLHQPNLPCPSFAPLPENGDKIKRKRGRPRSDTTPEFSTQQMRDAVNPLGAVLRLCLDKRLASLDYTQRKAELEQLKAALSGHPPVPPLVSRPPSPPSETPVAQEPPFKRRKVMDAVKGGKKTMTIG